MKLYFGTSLILHGLFMYYKYNVDGIVIRNSKDSTDSTELFTRKKGGYEWLICTMLYGMGGIFTLPMSFYDCYMNRKNNKKYFQYELEEFIKSFHTSNEIDDVTD